MLVPEEKSVRSECVGGSGLIWAASTSAEDSCVMQSGQTMRREGDAVGHENSVYLAWIENSAVDKYSQHVYHTPALNPVIPKGVQCLLDLLWIR